jgi:tetratricopeptide (TPR) repeat protein
MSVDNNTTMKNIAMAMALMLVFSMSCYAQQKAQQKIQQKIQQSDALFKNFYYTESIEGYKEVLKLDEKNIPVQLRIADAYTKLHNAKAAAFWYDKALTSSENIESIPNDYLFSYAEVLTENKKYDEALQWYQKYKANTPNDTRVDKKIEVINNRSTLYSDSMRYEVKKMEFNSEFSDFGPAFYDSGLVFASARDEVSKAKRYNRTNSAYLDLYYTNFHDTAWSAPEKFHKSINDKYHEGSAIFYDHNSKMIFTRNIEKKKLKPEELDEEKAESTLHLQLYYTEKREDGEWIEPVPLPINDEEYSMGHPAISQDGRYLYFSSNVPGYGGTDIYVSEWRNDQWTKPRNLGEEINTSGDEMFPFLHRDSVLYFSSNGHGGVGGLDIFSVNINEGKIKNLGYPLNTHNDDFSIIVSPEGKTGFFASNRLQEANDDLYQFFVKEIPVIKEEPQPEIVPEKEVYYTVQIMALLNPVTVRKSVLKGLKGVLKHDGVDGFHRYTFGTYATPEEAEGTLEQIKSKGYGDAFIRKVERYKELSRAPGVEVEKLRKD